MLQWRYIAGNNWGMCADGTGAVGCGAQEEFRACADINIGDVGPQPPLRPIRPGTGGKATTRAPTTALRPNGTEAEGGAEEQDSGADAPWFVGLLIAVVALLVVLCFLVGVYLYSYHGQRLKQLLHWNRGAGGGAGSKQPPTEPWSTPITVRPPAPNTEAPVAPPRTKRLSHQSPAAGGDDGEATHMG